MAFCPQCTGEIKEAARKCPHCKAFIDPALAAERMGPPPGDASEPVEIDAGGGETVSATGLVFRSCLELAFAFGTLVLGPICGGLTLLFSGWEVFRSLGWNNEYRRITGRNSVGALSAVAISALAAVLAGIFTWMMLQEEGF